MSQDTEILKNLTELNTGDLSMLFQEAFHASPLVMQVKGRANQMTVISGLRCLELSERLNRPLLLAKMLVASSVWKMAKHLTEYSLTWVMKGTPQNNLLFQLVPSGLGTEEIGYGLLPTPMAQEGPGCQQMKLTDAVEIMEGRLPKYYKMFPTATARDYKDGTAKSCQNVESKGLLGREIHKTTDQIGSLNPQWVEWLMGYPAGWTDLKD